MDFDSTELGDGNARGAEIELLVSMYPDDLIVDQRNSQVTFSYLNARLQLRLPSDYPRDELPEILEATDIRKLDVRGQAQHIIAQQQKGEPCLDAIITGFIGLVESTARQQNEQTSDDGQELSRSGDTRNKTVIIWLHHLLATNKRKLALSAASGISGITKPGYPGVMIFTGPADAVHAHVQELKQQRWQAFQIRYEVGERWEFEHGEEVREVETMADVVSSIGNAGEGHQKELFLEAMKMR